MDYKDIIIKAYQINSRLGEATYDLFNEGFFDLEHKLQVTSIDVMLGMISLVNDAHSSEKRKEFHAMIQDYREELINNPK